MFVDGFDYDGRKEQLSFASGSASGAFECVDIEIIEDRIKERNETFVFSLSAGGDEAVHIIDHYATVHILDDDSTLWPDVENVLLIPYFLQV